MDLNLFKDLKGYNRKKLSSDLIAGITVAIILVPQAMAYAMLAGLPAVYGLYTALIPLFIYPIFASCSSLSVGPVALISIILLSMLSGIEDSGSQKYIDLVLLTGLIAGILQVLYVVFRVSNLTRFLHQALMKGFISAAGVIIIVSQLKNLMGIDMSNRRNVVNMFTDLIENLPSYNTLALGLGLLCLCLLTVFTRISKSIPKYLMVVLVGILIVYLRDLQPTDLTLVGSLPKGLPVFYSGFINLDTILSVLPAAFVISIVCFVGSYSLANALCDNKKRAIDPNQELIGLGLAKIISSFFGSMPSTSSFSRSAINTKAGAETNLSSWFAAAIVGIALLFLSRVFYFLPESILAAIVIYSVIGLVDWKKAIFYWKKDKIGFTIFIFTFIMTCSVGIGAGIFFGIGFSLLLSFVLNVFKTG